MSARLRQSGDSSSLISQTSITIKSCAASTFYAKTSRLRSGSNTYAPVVCASMLKVIKQAAGTTTSAASIHYVMARRSFISSSDSPSRCRCPPMRLACRVIFLQARQTHSSHSSTTHQLATLSLLQSTRSTNSTAHTPSSQPILSALLRR